MLWGGAGVIAGLLGIAPLAQVLLWIPYISLLWTVSMVVWTAALPDASLEIVNYGGLALATTYLLLALLRWRGWLSARIKQLRIVEWSGAGLYRVAGSGAMAGMAVAAFLVWRIALTQPDGYLHIHFLDIGQGDGVFIQTPSGRQVLVDGGNDPQRLFAELGAAMPFWDRAIDMLLLTHPDLDHMGAQLAVPECYTVAQAVVSAVTLADADGQAWREVTTAATIPAAVQSAGGWIDLGDWVALWFLWSPDETALAQMGVDLNDKNEQSLVAMLVYCDLHLLLSGDAGLPSERAMIRADVPLAAQILKVGHHGSDTSTGADFVGAVDPSIAIIQVGENRDGHPTQEVLDALSGRLVLRNDLDGPIHLWSDGRQLWLDADE